MTFVNIYGDIHFLPKRKDKSTYDQVGLPKNYSWYNLQRSRLQPAQFESPQSGPLQPGFIGWGVRAVIPHRAVGSLQPD